MFNFKAEFYLKIIFLFSFIALISAFFIEYILGHQPCNLCLIERIPYILSIIIIIAIFLIKKNQKFLVLLLIFTFIFSFTKTLVYYILILQVSGPHLYTFSSDFLERDEILYSMQHFSQLGFLL